MDWLEWSFYLQSMILRELLAAACAAPLPRPRPPLPLPLPLPLPSPVALVDVFIASPRPCFPKKWSRCLMKNIMYSVSGIYHIKLFSYSRELKDITKPNVLTKPYQQIKWTLPRLTCLSYGYMYHKHNLIMKFTKQITIFFLPLLVLGLDVPSSSPLPLISTSLFSLFGWLARDSSRT